MPIEIKWINHASFRIASGRSVLYIDPWKIPDAPHDADVVFVSHSHYDHCSGPDIDKVQFPEQTIKSFEDYDLVYRTLCGILYNFVPTSSSSRTATTTTAPGPTSTRSASPTRPWSPRPRRSPS